MVWGLHNPSEQDYLTDTLGNDIFKYVRGRLFSFLLLIGVTGNTVDSDSTILGSNPGWAA